MKKIYRILQCFTIGIILFSALFFDKTEAYAHTLSQGEIVMEKTSGRVLYESDADKKLPMASTTKILTALAVIENFPLDRAITVPDECAGIEGSSVYLKGGDKYTVEDLLYGLMLRSGNDCAETLAKTLCGSIKKFVDIMNETAIRYGAKNSNFTNPHGLPDPDHYTTARDLGIIACAAMRNENFRKIVSSKKHVATELVSGQKNLWINKNKMLYNYDGASGVKTGYTVKAGRCLVSSAERNGMEVVCVVLNSPQMFERSSELLDNAFGDYKMQKLVDKDAFDYVLPCEDGITFIPVRIGESFSYPVKNNDRIEVGINLNDKLSAAARDGEEAGDITITCNDRLIFSEKIYTRIENA